jgi:hypothetical protein
MSHKNASLSLLRLAFTITHHTCTHTHKWRDERSSLFTGGIFDQFFFTRAVKLGKCFTIVPCVTLPCISDGECFLNFDGRVSHFSMGIKREREWLARVKVKKARKFSSYRLLIFRINPLPLSFLLSFDSFTRGGRKFCVLCEFVLCLSNGAFMIIPNSTAV